MRALALIPASRADRRTCATWAARIMIFEGFPIEQVGTYWYQRHDGFQEQKGLYGPLILEPRAPESYRYDRDYVVILLDWTDEDPARIVSNLKQSEYYNFHQRPVGTFIKDVRHMGLKATLADRLMLGTMLMAPTHIMDFTEATYTFLVNRRYPAENWTALFSPGARVRLWVSKKSLRMDSPRRTSAGPAIRCSRSRTRASSCRFARWSRASRSSLSAIATRSCFRTRCGRSPRRAHRAAPIQPTGQLWLGMGRGPGGASRARRTVVAPIRSGAGFRCREPGRFHHPLGRTPAAVRVPTAAVRVRRSLRL